MGNYNTNTQTFINEFERQFNDQKEFTQEQEDALVSLIPSKKDLENGLNQLKIFSDKCDENIELCDKNAKQWAAQKKALKAQSDAFKKLLGRLLEKLAGGTKIKNADGIALKNTSRNGIEVDSEWLLSQYSAQADELRNKLPEFVKVELSVDKNKLSAHLQQDNSLMLDNPEKIHFKKGTSVTIK